MTKKTDKSAEKSANKYEKRHRRNTKAYQKKIDKIFDEAAREAAILGTSIDGVDTSKVFSFADYPSTKKRIDTLLNTLTKDIRNVIVNGINLEWTLANNKNNTLVGLIFGDNKLSAAQERKYYSTNDSAREAFLARKESGLNLSDRVWNYTNQFKTEIELGLDVGIRQGLSADEMTRDLKQYLKYPDKLFRRVRDEHGNLQLSKAAQAFHPGRGVYRSSYKNARRLTATETNIAYRSSDYERWQAMDFVIGIEVVLSNNHPVPDICDDLAGRYPKDFKFTGWHPHCRCHAISILKSDEELAEDTRRILAGEEPLPADTSKVDYNGQAKLEAWMADNADRVLNAQNLPYFIKDNPKYTTDILGSE